jgi:hypothetical protein
VNAADGGNPTDVVDAAEAAQMLEVGREQLDTLVRDGLLEPAADSDREHPTFTRAAVWAVAHLGG